MAEIECLVHLKNLNATNLVSLDKSIKVGMDIVEQEEKKRAVAHWLIDLPADNVCKVRIELQENK